MTKDEIRNDPLWLVVKGNLKNAFLNVRFPFVDVDSDFKPFIAVLMSAFEQNTSGYQFDELVIGDRYTYISGLISEFDQMYGAMLQYTLPRLLVITTEEQLGGCSYVPHIITSLNILGVMLNDDEVASAISSAASADVGERWLRQLKEENGIMSDLKREQFSGLSQDQIRAVAEWLIYIGRREDLKNQDSSGEFPPALLYWNFASRIGRLP